MWEGKIGKGEREEGKEIERKRGAREGESEGGED